MTRISVLCLDMAGTTVADGDSVLTAFTAALSGQALPVRAFNAAMRYVQATMGQSKIEVFRHVLEDEAAAQRANAAFEAHYAKAVADGQITAMPGAEDLFAAARDAGIRVCLSTGFSPATRDAIISALHWEGRADLLLAPADAGRGRPWPDMPLAALLRLGGGSVHELAVAGDTPSDIEAGLRAGAGLVAGVLTGDSPRADLEAVSAATGLPGTPVIVDSVAGLRPYLGLPA
ncbi:MAG TPA: HAD family hydrolase [Trebonia sp.]|nr:HAD family hydrolase [Trebonia sp.]